MSQSLPTGFHGSNKILWLDGHLVPLGNIFLAFFMVLWYSFIISIVDPVSNDTVFKNWGWTLQVSVEHLWQNALNETGSVHPPGDWHPSHSTQNLVQLILCILDIQRSYHWCAGFTCVFFTSFI